MPPPPQAVGQEPSLASKLTMGATMGGMVGLTIGFIFGSAAILRNGAGPKGFFGSLSQYMLTSGATFAFFMSIGTVIRTDDGLEYTPHRPLLHGPNLPPVAQELLRRQRERQE